MMARDGRVQCPNGLMPRRFRSTVRVPVGLPVVNHVCIYGLRCLSWLLVVGCWLREVCVRRPCRT